jgi:hypothetical protein
MLLSLPMPYLEDKIDLLSLSQEILYVNDWQAMPVGGNLYLETV